MRSERADAEPGFGPFKRDAARRPGPKRDDEARTVRSAAEEAVARGSRRPGPPEGAGRASTPAGRPALRIVRNSDGRDAGIDRVKAAPGRAKGKSPKRAASPAGVSGAPRAARPSRDGNKLQEAMVRGARALDRGYEREALRILRPFRDPHPDSADLRELLGLTYYRLGRWALAQKELEAFVGLTDSTEQHPVLMDCARALGRYKRVETLWEELRAASPGAELVTEGRIVAAGALADRGKLAEAIAVLERAPGNPKRILPHHLRLWYALADLRERAGDIPAARSLFRRISAEDPTFVDVAERLAALS